MCRQGDSFSSVRISESDQLFSCGLIVNFWFCEYTERPSQENVICSIFDYMNLQKDF